MIRNYDEMTLSELQDAYELLFEQRYPDDSLLLRRVLNMRAALKKANFRIAELESFLSAYEDRPEEAAPPAPQEEPTP